MLTVCCMSANSAHAARCGCLTQWQENQKATRGEGRLWGPRMNKVRCPEFLPSSKTASSALSQETIVNWNLLWLLFLCFGEQTGDDCSLVWGVSSVIGERGIFMLPWLGCVSVSAFLISRIDLTNANNWKIKRQQMLTAPMGMGFLPPDSVATHLSVPSAAGLIRSQIKEKQWASLQEPTAFSSQQTGSPLSSRLWMSVLDEFIEGLTHSQYQANSFLLPTYDEKIVLFWCSISGE